MSPIVSLDDALLEVRACAVSAGLRPTQVKQCFLAGLAAAQMMGVTGEHWLPTGGRA